MKPTLVVLAAGIGSRYGGLKQIDTVGPSGEAIIDYSIFDAIRAGFGKVVFVVRRSIEKDVRAFFEPRLDGKIAVEFAFQELDMLPKGISLPPDREKPWGTAHAVLAAREKVEEPFAVINGDDYYGPSSYVQLAEFLKENVHPDEYAMVGFRLDKTLSPWGSVARGICKVSPEHNLVEVKEHTRIFIRDDKIISELEDGNETTLQGSEYVSMNFWGFKPSIFGRFESLFARFLRERINDLKAEFFIPLPLTDLINAGAIKLKVLQGREQWFGVTYQKDKPEVIARIKKRIEEGIYPEDLWG